MNHLYAKLEAEKTCPVCCAPAMPMTQQQERLLLVRFECSAILGVSGMLNVIVVNEPCPRPSHLAVEHMVAEVTLAGVK